jgi:rubrerythrin
MEFSHDEVRRQLVDVERAHRAAVPTWRDALRRVFDPERSMSDEAKAQMLGLPDRRGFLRIGGATVAMSAIIAACGSESSDEQLPVTGTLPAEAGDPRTAPTGNPVLDLNLLRTAQSIEVLAVDTYDVALETDLIPNELLRESMTIFRDQHRDHAATIAGLITEQGGEPYDEPNAYLLDTVVGPTVEGLASEDDVLLLAIDLENTAAQTYVFAAEVLTTPELRQGVMSIGGIEARHLSVIALVQAQPPVPFSFMPRRASIDPNGYVDGDAGLDA